MSTASTTAEGTVRRVLQRVVFPESHDVDVLPLYVDPDRPQLDVNTVGLTGKQRGRIPPAEPNAETPPDPHAVLGRRRYRVKDSDHISFGTYFNAFAASYWRRWTVVTEVSLHVRVTGAGSTVVVYRSMPDGRAQRVDDARTTGPEAEDLRFDLSLQSFTDGGWYWFDIVAGTDGAVLEEASWAADVPADRRDARHGHHRHHHHEPPRLLRRPARPDRARPGRARRARRGRRRRAGHQEGRRRPRVRRRRGGPGQQAPGDRAGQPGRLGRLRPLPARDPRGGPVDVHDVHGRRRGLRAGEHRARGHLRRPVPPADHRRRAHVQPVRQGPAAQLRRDHQPLPVLVDVPAHGADRLGLQRAQPALLALAPPPHRRGLQRLVHVPDPDRGAARRSGSACRCSSSGTTPSTASRAAEAGYPTVTLPGAAVWHVPWTDKNDALDWQAYFHQRNRFIAALLHSPYDRGGRMVRESFNHQIKHLFAMQYSTAELRHKALQDVLAGPEVLHEELGTKLPQLRGAALSSSPTRRPWPTPTPSRRSAARSRPSAARTRRCPRAGSASWSPPRRPARSARPAQARRSPTGSRRRRLAAMDAKWWMIAAVRLGRWSRCPTGPAPPGTTATARSSGACSRRPLEIHQRLYREWPALAERLPRRAAGDHLARSAGGRRSTPPPAAPDVRHAHGGPGLRSPTHR